MSDHPELGQLAFGNPTGNYPCPHWCDALVREVLRQIEIWFFNKNQRAWDLQEDPTIPGVECRPYYWGDDETEAARPNLSFDGVEVRWYKHPMRGSSLNVEAEPYGMVEWFETCLSGYHPSRPPVVPG